MSFHSILVGYNEYMIRGWLILGIFLAAVGPMIGQGPKAGPDKKEPAKKEPINKEAVNKEPDKKEPAKKGPVEPNDLVEELKSLFSGEQKWIFIRKQEYQAMQDRLRALEGKGKPDKQLPSVCQLSGKVKGDFVTLQVDFAFETAEPKRTVVLGLQGGHLTDEGKLDGQPALLDYGPEGFLARVDRADKHQLTLNLKAPVTSKRTATPGGGAERGFELGLPGAATTLLSLELPAAVQEISCNEHAEKWQPSWPKGKWDLTLGHAKTLSLSWKEPVTLPGTGPLLSAEGKIAVKLEENQVVTTAELDLTDLRGQAEELRLWLPAQAKVEVKSPGLVKEIVPPDEKSPCHVIRLTRRSFEKLPIEVKSNQPRSATVPRLAIGPFFLEGAHKQEGSIVIRAQPEAIRGQRWTFHRHGDIYQREMFASAGPDVLAVFAYQDLPRPDKAASAKRAGIPLELEWKAEKGHVETFVEHKLQLIQLQLVNGGEGYQADLTTKIKVKSLSAGVDFVDVQLPRPRPVGLAVLAWGPIDFPTSLPWGSLVLTAHKYWPVVVPAEFIVHGEGGVVAELQTPDAARRARITVSRLEAREFNVVLTGKYMLPAHFRQANLELPRPLGLVDRGGKVTLVGNDSVDVLAGPGEFEDIPPGQKQQTLTWDQAPNGLDLSWRPHQPEFLVQGLADITVHGSVAQVKHELKFSFPAPGNSGRASPDKSGRQSVTVRVSPGVRLRPQHRLSYQPEKGEARLHPADDARAEQLVTLEYDFSLPPAKPAAFGPGKGQPARDFSIPLLWPDKATRIDAKVRVWCDPGVSALPLSVGESWRNRGPEIDPARDALPALVLHGTGSLEPLALRLLENPGNLPDAVIDRGLIRVSINEEGTQLYRARFLVRKLNADHLDIALPAPAAGLIQSITLHLGEKFGDRKRIQHWSSPENNSHVVRIPVQGSLFQASLSSQPVILDLEYKLSPSALESRTWTLAAFKTTLHPPIFQNEVFLGPLRWHVLMPADWVAIVGGGNSQIEYQWAFDNGLFIPEPTAAEEDLERWLSGSWLSGAAGGATRAGGLVFWRTSLEPRPIWHFPRQMWFLLCSGALLALGLGISLLSPARRLMLAVLLLVLAGAGLAAGFFWPALLPWLVYGAQPGLVVLLLVLGVQWLLHERYRRQVVFMPGFKRVSSNSSLVRAAAGRPREPSTVDAPPAKGSSQVGTMPQGS